MLNSDTAKTVKENGGTIVYLDVPFDECYDRIKGDTNRPIVMNNTKEQLEEIYNKRCDIYIENSTVRVEAVGTPAGIAEVIADTLK